MQLPTIGGNFNVEALIRTCESLCLDLKFKNTQWEMFLLDKQKQKCKRFLKLQELVYDYIKKGGN